jgi:hypothetical protein
MAIESHLPSRKTPSPTQSQGDTATPPQTAPGSEKDPPIPTPEAEPDPELDLTDKGSKTNAGGSGDSR